MSYNLNPSDIDTAIQRLNRDLGKIMKDQLIAKMEEIIKPELDKILEETAEEMIKSLKVNMSHRYDMFMANNIFKLQIKDKAERVI